MGSCGGFLDGDSSWDPERSSTGSFTRVLRGWFMGLLLGVLWGVVWSPLSESFKEVHQGDLLESSFTQLFEGVLRGSLRRSFMVVLQRN